MVKAIDEVPDPARLLRTLGYLDGTRFCVVLMQVIDQAAQQVKLTPIYGVARVHHDRLMVEEDDGRQVVVPDSALPSILPSDGTPILKNAEHYVVVKVGVQ